MFWYLIFIAVIVTAFVYMYTHTRETFDVAPSKIHGVGVYTRMPVEKSTKLFDVVSGKSVTALGSTVNHSYTPNCALKDSGNGVWSLYALVDIPANTELTGNYDEAPPFLQRAQAHFV